ncbi:MAG TPA: aminotransferase class I/II-fold pyridoxal phosphate-dependent enzyme [candidate division Zixibacteria bacterium]|nr:aminotransferase class I/II-fold pyridoxal phosphate-dependent enzyme [candidate division Zixibacteria bacterium]
MTTRDPTGFLVAEYQELVNESRDWKHRTLETGSDPECVIDGKKVIMMCSNNYLNLSTHPHVVKKALEAVEKYGAGSGSVRAIAGNMWLHEELERRLAEFKEQEAVMITQTGYAANAGVIPQLVSSTEDVIISDELNHGSIIDGVRLAKAQRGPDYIYPHSDMGGLEKCLKNAEKINARRILITTDGVFSMDGDAAKLDGIQKLAEQYGAMIYVDDAHGDGVLGRNKSGKGIVDHYGLQGKVQVEMNTFSKAMGTVGGAITGSQDLVNFCRNKTRTYLLSGSHPPAIAGASIGSIEVLMNKEGKFEPVVAKLLDNCDYFKNGIVDLGFNHPITVAAAKTPTGIMPIICGENDKAKAMSNRLFEEGIFALPIVFPMVPKGTARIRVMMTAGLTKNHLNTALAAFEKIGKELDII